MKKCFRCGEPATTTYSRPALCEMHRRFWRMRHVAKARNLSVPSLNLLDELAKELQANGMMCIGCHRVMQWGRGPKNRSTRVTLQHDRNGRIRFLCTCCNRSHWAYPGDTFYDLPPKHKLCGRCRQVKPLSDFHRKKTAFRGTQQYCRQCVRIVNRRRSPTHRTPDPCV